MRPTVLRRRPAALVVLLSGTALVAGAVVGPPASAGGGPAVTVVADGLDNPRHLVVDRRGDVFVAEAGRGAKNPATAPCVDAANPETGETETFCYGRTGSIVRIRGRHVKEVVSDLPSVAGLTGEGAGGVTDLTVPKDGKAVGVVNMGGDPRNREAFLPGPAIDYAGHLLELDLKRDRFRVGADVAAFEERNNPDAADPGSSFDSNPYAVAASRKAGRLAIADAGGNDLLTLDRRGRVRLVAVFPATLVDAPPFLGLPPGTKIPMQAVPNSVEQGPDGAWYVGQLTGFPFPQGAAKVWRVVPGKKPVPVAEGFTNVIDIAFDRKGRLLVLEIATRGLLDPTSPGALWRVDAHGKRTLVTDDLAAPGGVAVGKDGHAYVTNRSTSVGEGQVLRIRLPR